MSTFSTYSSLYSPQTAGQRSSLASRPATDEPDWHRSSTVTDSGSFEMAYDRLSEMIQMDIVQAYYGMQSRADTPMPSTLDDTAQVTPPTKEAWNRPGSFTDSEILRSLSLYDSEFEALLATPDNPKRTSPLNQRQSERLSQASTQLVNNITEAIARRSSSDHDQQSVKDSIESLPTAARPSKSVLSEVATDTDLGPAEETSFSSKHTESLSETSEQLQRRINLAELLAIEDARAPQNDDSDGNQTIKSRVELVLHSLIAHLDVIKLEYASDTQKLIAQRDCLRQELRPMLQMRAALHQDNQRLASRADELNALIEQLETHSRQIQAEKPLPDEGHRDGVHRVNLQRSTTSERVPSKIPTSASREALSRAKTQTSATPSSSNARLDASLPPLPEPRRFRWIKPRLLSNQDLAAFGESLLQPAFEIKRTPSTITPPVPPKSNQSSTGSSDIVHAQNHVFQTISVLRPSARCFVCMRNVWGQTEMRCHACQQVCHSDCISYISSVCPAVISRPFTSQSESLSSPQMTSESLEASRESMVGRSLIEQANLENQPVPRLIEWCVAAVEKNGLGDEGLYRKNGGIQQQRTILQLFDSGQPFDLADLGKFNDVGAITSALKYYLRELPEPLIPSEFHEAYLAFGERMTLAPRAVALSAMRRLLSQLPEPHYASLKRLCLHLKLVEQRSGKTRMSARNLGLVFGPTIMHANHPARELIETGTYARTVECTFWEA
ncbi:Rho-type gtpase-activating protein [Malassezia yamatoensis]|uniref:Rho-type gtpase-activating protein n=1 Tax=Malassezia yamatoensis TaxID=253288 RepID=A0AAJ5YSQ7_9BASI|nr:Rho-type gtpase-activating protein [Malassezia yamatoensis]